MNIFTATKNVPATADMSPYNMKSLNIRAGCWIEINDKSKIYYCRVWPADIPADHVHIDDYIYKNRSEAADGEKAALIRTIDPINAIQVTIEVSLKKNVTPEQQIADIGFVFKEGSQLQKIETLRYFINGMVATAGVTLCRSSTPSVLSVKIISTYPENVPVILTNATRIKIIPKDQTAEKQITLKQIDDAMKKLTITSNTTDENNDATKVIKETKPSGLEKAYDSLLEMVSYPFIYQNWIDHLGIECPKGILLYGPPGVGKTFLVSSVAKYCNAQLVVIQGPELYGPYVGESEEKLRNRFQYAQQLSIENQQPVILFIDEIDALTPHREQSQSHENRMVAQLLTLMDGVKHRGKLVVVGATNRPNAIDPALRRPGRFDREISVDAPDFDTRYKLLSLQLKTVPIHSSVNIEQLAQSTNGYVAADINSLCREAALNAVRRNQMEKDQSINVTIDDFKIALSKVGPSMQRGYQINIEKKDWQDIGGLEEVKKKLKQAVEWPLMYKDSFDRLGLKPSRGILLYGPPGCSKTTLVKVIASVSGASFFSINGAQLYSPYVGDSEKVVRTTFQRARASAPSIIFLDETEAIVGKRNMGNGGSSSGDSVQERILSTLLNEMDGVESADSVLVVGATNRPDMLDAALMRPGRFDKLVYVPPPDYDARLEILQIHTRKMPLDSGVNLEAIALMTDMYTGADLKNICREAAMMALRRDTHVNNVAMQDFEESLATIPASITSKMLESYNQPINT
ncbi:unnamed protein product [Cunninghamella blakesleeana]